VIGPDTPPDPKDAFATLIEGASEYAVFTLSPAGVVSSWTRGAELIKGYRREEIVGRHFSVFYLPADRDAGIPDQQLRDALRDGRLDVEGWRVRRDGSRFWASVLIVPLWDAAGRLRGFGKLTRDETERRAAHALEQQLSRLTAQERTASVLAGTVVRQLFAVGLQLNTAMKLATGPELRHRVAEAAEGVDEAIKYLRRAAFDYSAARRAGPQQGGYEGD
jgi:PAS domain S-box-containing protein